ncbi:MAG: MFS transporter, partial [Canibacter sp.]
LEDLSEPLRLVVEQAYGHGVGNIFLAVAPVALITILATSFLPNIPLQTKSAAQQRAAAAVRSGEGMSVAEADQVAVLMTGEIPVQEANDDKR